MLEDRLAWLRSEIIYKQVRLSHYLIVIWFASDTFQLYLVGQFRSPHHSDQKFQGPSL